MREIIKKYKVAVLICLCLLGCSADVKVAPETFTGDNTAEMEEDKQKTEEQVQEEQGTAAENTLGVIIHYLDVGQADAAFVMCDGHSMLIDGGNKEDSSLIYSVMKQYDIESLDILIGSHSHEDHIGGLPGAFAYCPADITLCPVDEYDSEAFRDFSRYAEEHGNGIVIPEVGDEYKLGSAKVEVLGLNAESEDENDSSIILRMTYGETSFLFTGDAEFPAEKAVIESGADLNATVLKVGHHGSDSSTSEQFLDEVSPEIAVISVGENDYGHPTKEVLERLESAGAAIYRTDKNGDIIICSDGKNVTVEVEKQASEEEILSSGENHQSIEKESGKAENESQERDFVANKISLKLHYPDCDSVKDMKEKNKLYLHGTRNEFISEGYDPCGVCKP